MHAALRPFLLQKFQTLRRFSRILWVRVALILALSILATFATELFDPLIPEGPKNRFTQAATMPILTIIASSMLAVATFSLGVMVSSHRTMAEQTTPRIHRLLMEDTSTQSMIATFLGAFAYALSSIILFRAGYYSESASVIVFFTTVLVVIAIIVSLVRWIHQLSRIGSMDYALERAEEAVRETLEARGDAPCLGGVPKSERQQIPDHAAQINAPCSGFLGRIDMQELQELAETLEARIYIDVLPGDLVLSGQPVGFVTAQDKREEMSACFMIGPNRTHEQDPRYALQAMCETASKALSPGVNDAGTAVEVVARLERLLWDGLRRKEAAAAPAPVYDRVFVAQVSEGELIKIALQDVARDGAAHVEVLIAVSRAIDALAELCEAADCAQTIEDMRAALTEHAQSGLRTKTERARLSAVSAAFDQTR